jgi:hypothetical protein
MDFPRFADCRKRLGQLAVSSHRQPLTSSCALKHGLVVQAQPQLWHTRQVALHLHRAQDLTTDDVTRRIDLEEGKLSRP